MLVFGALYKPSTNVEIIFFWCLSYLYGGQSSTSTRWHAIYQLTIHIWSLANRLDSSVRGGRYQWLCDYVLLSAALSALCHSKKHRIKTTTTTTKSEEKNAKRLLRLSYDSQTTAPSRRILTLTSVCNVRTRCPFKLLNLNVSIIYVRIIKINLWHLRVNLYLPDDCPCWLNHAAAKPKIHRLNHRRFAPKFEQQERAVEWSSFFFYQVVFFK